MTVKMGFKTFKVEKPLEMGNYYGEADYDKSIIKIADRYDNHSKNCTFIHEILHCICLRFGLEKLNNDEHAIDLLATGIYEAMIDNPHIFTMQNI